ncbi:MFS transporter, partial [Jatrophihabitans sp.]|uniref:MFS transporter n=1 Tax=Jatrophihabitans sp. TaxID=1932789 RepID=UPI002EF858F2
ALAVLVFERTSSALLTALAYALTFAPALLGGLLLSGLADRLPRRQVMVGCDVIRCVLLGCMAIPRVPIWLLCALLVVAVLTETPFMAAESSLMPVMLDGEHYIVGTGLRSITNQLAQLAGFAGGGLVIALIGARAGLALDAATFGVSAVLIMVGVKARPAAMTDPAGEHSAGPGLLSGLNSVLALIFGDPKLRTLIGLSWLAGLFVVPEGVAAPYASDMNHGAVAIGLLLASMPAGTALGTYLLVRFVPNEARSVWMGPMAVAVGVPLALCALHPNLVLSLVLWTVSGLFFGYQVQVVTVFVRTVPDHQRGQAIGIASSGLLAVQGFGVLLGGAVASLWGVNAAVASAGLVGGGLAVLLSWNWHRAASADPHSDVTGLAEPHTELAEPHTELPELAEPHPELAEPIVLATPAERVAEDRSSA